MANIGILGHGTVGSGVAQLLIENADIMRNRAGEEIKLSRICDLREFDVPYASIFTKDATDIIEGDDIDMVVECMGGLKPAFEFVKTALRNKKHVITSNKELIAVKGAELLKIAKENRVNLMFEASVGGGIPIIRPLRQCLSANHIERIDGILNGTTNYILTRMKDGKASFDESLKEAMAMGYAERDPSADIKGWDSRRKICILAHVAFGAPLDDSNIPCEGIENLTKEDMVYAKKLGCTVKLLAVAEKVEGGYYAYVGPAMVPVSQMIAYVEGVFNAISVHGDMVGDVMFYGPGAGSLPTASAISADIIDCVWHASGIKAADSYSESVQPLDAGRAKTKLFIRVSGEWGGKEERYIKGRLPGVEIIRLYEKPDEFAFITSQDAYCTLYDMVKSLKEKVPVLQSLRYLG